MRFKFLFFLLILGTWLIPLTAKGQDYEQMRKAILKQQAKTRHKIQSITDLISQYQNELQTTSQKYEEVYKQYKKLKRQLALHKKKIAKLEEKQHEIQKEIEITEKKINALQDKLHKLISNYKKALRYVYEHGRTSRLALLLTSASIHQMLIRNYYLKKFEEYRERQVAKIKKAEKELKETKKERQQAAQKNKKVLAAIRKEKEKLARQTKQQKENIAILRSNKEKLSQKLAQIKEQKKNLNQTLNHLIAREKEIRKARKRALAARRKKKAKKGASAVSETARRTGFVGKRGFLTDKQLEAIQAGFAKQKGNLRWPVASHTVSEHFGLQTNPIYGTVTPNLGIEIVTEPHAPVHVVYRGYVFAVRPVTGYGNVVFVSHGKYKTAYGNLSRVTVRKHTILKAGQVVGYAGDKTSARGASVFFMLRVGDKNVDPEEWLK